MANDTPITESIEGHPVVSPSGDEIGIVSSVTDGVPYVDPEPGLTDEVLSALEWDEIGRGDYRLDPADIERVTDDEVHVVRYD